jgi:hypothetical protein
MSFQGLVGGADCGPINPLAQVLKHTEGDRSLQQVRWCLRYRVSGKFLIGPQYLFRIGLLGLLRLVYVVDIQLFQVNSMEIDGSNI